MPYRNVEGLTEGLQPEALLQEDLRRFDGLRAAVLLQFEEVNKPEQINDWLDFYRDMVANHQYSVAQFIELVILHVEQGTTPQVLPAD